MKHIITMAVFAFGTAAESYATTLPRRRTHSGTSKPRFLQRVII